MEIVSDETLTTTPAFIGSTGGTTVSPGVLGVPRGYRGTVLRVHGSLAINEPASDVENHIVVVRVQPVTGGVNAANKGLFAKVARQRGDNIGSPTNQFVLAEGTTNFEVELATLGRAHQIKSQGVASNAQLGWRFTGQALSNDTVIHLHAMIEYVLEFMHSGSTPAWEEDQDEDENAWVIDG